MRGGTWLDFVTFCALAMDVLRSFGGNMGVDEVTDGRLNAAGSMSGMMKCNEGKLRYVVLRALEHLFPYS